MHVLVLESEPGAAAETTARFVEAGHEVASCHEAGAPAFPCAGMVDGQRCPLDEKPIDVAIVVSEDVHGADLTPGEDGARCAMRQYVPVVLVGRHDHSPFVPYATAIATGPESAVDAAVHAVRTSPPKHVAAARAVLREVLDRHGLQDVDAEASVDRTGRDLCIRLWPEVEIPDDVAEIASVRVAGAIRSFDPHPERISVTVEKPE